MRIEDLDTPALILYLDSLEDNLNRYQHYFDKHGIGLRPHIKTHKCLAIAHMQMRKGAMGITCQKLGEVEVMVAGGITGDMLVPYNIIGRQKLERLASLARQVRMNVAADSEYTVRGLAETAQREDVEIGVVVELGGGRTGVTSAQAAVELGKIIDAAAGLELRGLMAMPTPPEARPRIRETLNLFDREGLPHPIVSGGCAANALQAHEIPELTEYRAGEYCVGGSAHLQRGTHTVEQCSLRVLTTVVSRPTPERAILDAGSKALSASTMQAEAGSSMGYIVEYPEAHLSGASEEHGHVDVSACTPRPQIGEQVQVLPVHPCPCVNEFDEIAVVQEGRVEAMWPVHARGQSR